MFYILFINDIISTIFFLFVYIYNFRVDYVIMQLF